MSKLEFFDGKQTSWMGLWWHPEMNCFTSPTINLAGLRKFKGCVRMYVRKNRYYNNGEGGRPNYCFSLRDVNAESEDVWGVEDIDEENSEKNGERMFTREEVLKVIEGTVSDVLCGITDPGDIMPEDFV